MEIAGFFIMVGLLFLGSDIKKAAARIAEALEEIDDEP